MACDAATQIASAYANGYAKLSTRELLEVIVAGACAGGGGSSQDMQWTWTPTTAKLGQDMGFSTGSDIPETALVFNGTTSLAGFQLFLGGTTLTFSMPNLVSIDPSSITFSGLSVANATSMTSITAPLLATIGGGGLSIQGCSSLTSLTFPALTHAGTGIAIKTNSSLSSLSLPVYVPVISETVDCSANALNVASVNGILARCVANAGYTAGTVDLSGGTNAAPAGQGAADKATLIGRGVTVNTN